MTEFTEIDAPTEASSETENQDQEEAGDRPASHSFTVTFQPFSVTATFETAQEYDQITRALRAGEGAALELADYMRRVQRGYLDGDD